MSTYNLCFEQKYEILSEFLSENSVFGGDVFNIFELVCFCNENIYRIPNK